MPGKLRASPLPQKKTEFVLKLDKWANSRHPAGSWFALALCVTLWLGLTAPCELTWALPGPVSDKCWFLHIHSKGVVMTLC